MDTFMSMLIVIIVMLVGMDLLSRVHPTLNKAYHGFFQVMVWNPLCWILRHAWNVLWRCARWIGHHIWRRLRWLGHASWRQIRRFIRFLGRQIRRGIVWTWRQVRTRLPIVVWALLCLTVATVIVKSLSSLLSPLRNIPWGTVGLAVLTVVLVVLLVWLFRRYGGGVRYSGRIVRRIKPGWLIVVLLLVGYGVLIYYKYPWDEDELNEIDERELKKSSCIFEVPDNITSDTFLIDVHSECPAIVKMKPRHKTEPPQMIVWWGDKSKFTSGWFFKERTTPSGVVRDKFRVFQARDVEYVTIKIHRYFDPDPLWYTRQ